MQRSIFPKHQGLISGFHLQPASLISFYLQKHILVMRSGTLCARHCLSHIA